MALEIRPVAGRRDLDTFVRLPFRLYRNEPHWVPPLVHERKQALDRGSNPFFRHAEAEYFLAWRDGRAVGRITAHVDRHFNEFQGNRWGLFGFFECEDDPEVAAALLGAAEGWLRERGRDRMVGPMSFTTNDECGVLIDGMKIAAGCVRLPDLDQCVPDRPPIFIEHAAADKDPLSKWLAGMLSCQVVIRFPNRIVPVERPGYFR